jgi:cytochrome c oxidase subunit I
LEWAAGFRYDIPLPEGGLRKLALGWLTLGVIALILSGLYSMLLVLSRTPYVKDAFPLVDLFHVALVVHVDLSVLVWFVAFAGVLWTLNSTPRWMPLGWVALALAAASAMAMSVAPFAGDGMPIMSNYIPVLDDPVFVSGIMIFAAGSAILVLRSIVAAPLVGVRIDGAGALRFGLNSALVSAAVALIAFVWSYLVLPHSLDANAYYEVLFWGGGHVLQFTYTLLMFVAWLWLASASRVPVPLTPRFAVLFFLIGLISVFFSPLIYLAHDVGSVEHRRLFTWLMQFGGSLAILPFSLAVAAGVAAVPYPAGRERPLRAALIASVVLFGVGGVIGLMIHGSNVKIPAHYHGSIVGVTLAFMGISYHLLPRLGFGRPAEPLASWQPYVYGGGQLLHIIGLVWSGGYGMQRKVAGAAQALRSAEEVAAMGLMGLGGLIAVVGGLMFVGIVIQAIVGKRSDRTNEA